MLDTTLLIVAVCALLLVNAAGIVLTAFQLPGTWLMVFATAVFAWFRWDVPAWSLGWNALATLLGLALLGEVLEFIAGAVGSRAAGGSKRGAAISILTAVAGAVVGSFAIPIPIVGTLIGAALGAALGASLGDKWAGRRWGEVARGASGAFAGKLTGAALKLAVAGVMFVAVLVALVW